MGNGEKIFTVGFLPQSFIGYLLNPDERVAVMCPGACVVGD